MQRLDSFVQSLEVDAACITSPANLFYLTGWRVSAMERFLALVAGPSLPPTLIVPGLEYENALRSTTGIEVHGWRDGEDPHALFGSILARATGSAQLRLGIEKPSVPVAVYEQMMAAVPGALFSDVAPRLSEMRQFKDSTEVQALAEAAAIADRAARAGLDTLAPGLVEADVADVMEGILRGSSRDPVFPTLVQSGPNGAFPHGATGDRVLQPGDLVVMDMGGQHRGYWSDITRTGPVGQVDDRSRQVFSAVLSAQEYAVQAVRPGVRARDVDAAARGYLDGIGLAGYFVHRTGHGIGIEIHEPPYIGPTDDLELVEGMAFSIEPGVYIPGWGGVRIEDIVVVTAGGCRRLNECKRDTLS